MPGDEVLRLLRGAAAAGRPLALPSAEAFARSYEPSALG
jgi:hypothetical protein